MTDPKEVVDQVFGPDPGDPKSDVSVAVERIKKWGRQAPPADMTNCTCSDCAQKDGDA